MDRVIKKEILSIFFLATKRFLGWDVDEISDFEKYNIEEDILPQVYERIPFNKKVAIDRYCGKVRETFYEMGMSISFFDSNFLEQMKNKTVAELIEEMIPRVRPVKKKK